MLVGAAALAQLRITSFNTSGELTWTNSARVGAYRVAWANSPAGPWNTFDTLTNLNLILARTNRVSAQLPLSNTPAFYRVAWIPPDPIGTWDYRGYDNQGALVITGQLSIASTTVLSTNPANPGYGIHGTWDLQFAGQTTNQLMSVGPQIGTGNLGGTLDIGYARLRLAWPPETPDNSIQIFGTLWPNTYTGVWVWAAGAGGFSAVRP